MSKLAEASKIAEQLRDVKKGYNGEIDTLTNELLSSQARNSQLVSAITIKEDQNTELTNAMIANTTNTTTLTEKLVASEKARGDEWKDLATSERKEFKELVANNSEFTTGIVHRLLVSFNFILCQSN